MGSFAEKLKAKKTVQEMFPPGSDSAKTYNNYSEKVYLDLLNVLQKHISSKKCQQKSSLLQFLYAGCLKFDRFIAPTPFVVPQDYRKNFEQFVQALIKAEGGITDNSKVFLLRIIRNEIYSKIDSLPLDRIKIDFSKYYKEKIDKIISPRNSVKLTEFEKEKEKNTGILHAIKNLSLKTKIKTRVPYILHQSPLNLSFTYEGVNSKLQATPIFSKTSVGFLNVDSAAMQVGPSKWQSGSTEIIFEFSALIDCDAFSEPLQAFIDHKVPIDGWPKCFVLAFKVLQEITWQLRLNYGGENSWIPTPSDFEDIEWTILSSTNAQIEWKLKSSPTALIRAFTPSTETLNLNIGPLEPTKWSVRCRSFAVMFFEIGQTNEAIFWLNVGVEALFEEGFVEIAKKSGKQNLEMALNSPKVFWDQAEDIVVKQFPQMAGKINWPDTEIHASIFAKLKYLYKSVEMKTNLKELTKRYSKIKSHRNDLFHGRVSTDATVEDVRVAIDCFNWIASNFDIKDKNNAE